MAKFVSQTEQVKNAAELQEAKLSSRYSRILASAPTPITYFHINNIESTTDSGFLDIQQVIGPNSPLRFIEIKNYPAFNMPHIQLELQDETQGLDVNFDGEFIHLPNTIKPFPNDLFIVDYLDSSYIFMITQVNFDTIKSNNYYNNTFTLRYIGKDKLDYLRKHQVTDRYTAILENVGTEENWLIQDDKVGEVANLNSFIENLKEQYKIAFYDNRTNTFLFHLNSNEHVYDRYVNKFIFDNMIYYDKMSTDALILNNEDPDLTLDYEYDESIFHMIERRRIKSLKSEYLYRYIAIIAIESIFTFYDMNVYGVRYMFGEMPYIRQQMVDTISKLKESNDLRYRLIAGYLNNEINSINDIDFEEIDNYNFRRYTEENYRLIPIIIYILKKINH